VGRPMCLPWADTQVRHYKNIPLSRLYKGRDLARKGSPDPSRKTLALCCIPGQGGPSGMGAIHYARKKDVMNHALTLRLYDFGIYRNYRQQPDYFTKFNRTGFRSTTNLPLSSFFSLAIPTYSLINDATLRASLGFIRTQPWD
jgi:hypothetical protein